MPLYEYHCDDCDKTFTEQRDFSDLSIPICPQCKSKNIRRLISRISIVKSEMDRARDVSWIDKNLAQRLRKKSGGRLSNTFKETLDWMESD